jgi:hypothetical protein
MAPLADRGKDVFLCGMAWHIPEQVVKPLPDPGSRGA